MKHFSHRAMLKTWDFIYTHLDHLMFAFKQELDKALPRQVRQLEYISKFSIDIRHISVAKKIVTDLLSRVDAIDVPYVQISNWSLRLRITKNNFKLFFEMTFLHDFVHSYLLEAISLVLWRCRKHNSLIVPSQLRLAIFNFLFNVNHQWDLSPEIRKDRYVD